LPRSANWIRRVNEPLDDKEIDAVRWSIRRGNPFGQANWVESIARRLDLESTLWARGRPKRKPISAENQNKESCPFASARQFLEHQAALMKRFLEQHRGQKCQFTVRMDRLIREALVKTAFTLTKRLSR